MLYNPPTGGAANDPFVGKNVAAGIQGSKVPPGAVEFPQRELVAVIQASGQSPSNDDLQQNLKAVRSGVLAYYSDAGTADALVITPDPAFTVVADGTEFVIHKGASPNATTTPVLTVNGVTRTISKQDGSTLGVGDLPGDGIFLVRALSGQYRVIGLRKSDVTTIIKSLVKQKLSGPLTAYIRGDGNDSTGDGSANSAAKAYASIPGALASIFNLYDLNGFLVTFTIGLNGEYVGPNFSGGSSNSYVISAAAGVTANITDGTGQGFSVASSGPTVIINGPGLTYKYNWNGATLPTECCLLARTGGTIINNGVGSNLVNARSNFTDDAAVGGAISHTGSIARAGASRYAFVTSTAGGTFVTSAAYTHSNPITVTGASFISRDRSGINVSNAATFSGSAVTGSKFFVDVISDINVNGGGINALPGSTAGTVGTNGGYYLP